MAQNITQIPAPRVPLIDERTGQISREWFRFLNNQYQLTGGGTTSTSLADLEVTPALAANTEDEIAVLKTQIDDIFKQPRSPEPTPINYGSFYSTQTQTAAAINTAYPITYNNTSYRYGIYIDPANISHIKVTKPAIYNIQFSIQLDKNSGGTGNFWIWPAINGTPVPDSASQIQIQGNNAEIFSAANFFLPLSNGDYFELYFAVSAIDVELAYFPEVAPVPAIPSIILTVMQVYI